MKYTVTNNFRQSPRKELFRAGDAFFFLSFIFGVYIFFAVFIERSFCKTDWVSNERVGLGIICPFFAEVQKIVEFTDGVGFILMIVAGVFSLLAVFFYHKKNLLNLQNNKMRTVFVIIVALHNVLISIFYSLMMLFFFMAFN